MMDSLDVLWSTDAAGGGGGAGGEWTLETALLTIGFTAVVYAALHAALYDRLCASSTPPAPSPTPSRSTPSRSTPTSASTSTSTHAPTHTLFSAWLARSPHVHERQLLVSYLVSTVHAIVAVALGALAFAHACDTFHTHSARVASLAPLTASSIPPPLRVRSVALSWPRVDAWLAQPWLLSDAVAWFLDVSVASFASFAHAAHRTPAATAAISLALNSTFSIDWFRELCLLLSCGYFAYDLVFMLWHARISSASASSTPSSSSSSFSLSLVLHHTIILTAFISGVLTHTGTLYMSLMLVNECSTLLLNANNVMSMFGVTSNSNSAATATTAPAAPASSFWRTCYRVNAVLLLLTFLVGRVVLNAACLAHMFGATWWSLRSMWWPPALSSSSSASLQLSSAETETAVDQRVRAEVIGGCLALSLLAAAHTALNLAWFIMLVRAAKRKLRAGSGAGRARAGKSTEKIE